VLSVIKILVLTTLFPNARQPVHGVFVENRLRHLLSSGQVTARVMAPVPWFPFTAKIFGNYSISPGIPRTETRHGIEVAHPQFPTIPKIGMSVAPWLMYWALKPHLLAEIRAGNDFDLIDAHYFYPDGVAAVHLARALSKPIVITARGTDLNLIADYAVPRSQIRWAAARADGMITVCQALKDRLVALGTAPDRVDVLRNGVDLEKFRPMDRDAARAELGLRRRTLLSVGYLIPRKGHDLVIRALATLPETDLLIAGDGPDRDKLEHLAESLGLAARVRFLGQVAHDDLPRIYTAADTMVLASSREGWANVLLESMACGTPVVATNVWGTAEAVTGPAAGILANERSPEALAAAIGELLAGLPRRADTRAYAEQFSWDDTTQGQIDLFQRVLAHR